MLGFQSVIGVRCISMSTRCVCLYVHINNMLVDVRFSISNWCALYKHVYPARLSLCAHKQHVSCFLVACHL